MDAGATVLSTAEMERRLAAPRTGKRMKRLLGSTVIRHGRPWLLADYNIIPIHPATKSPLVKFKQYMGQDSERVTDDDLIAWAMGLYRAGDGTYWLGPENPNFAIVLDSGPLPLVVVDADDPGTFGWCEEKFGATPLWTASGRAGGGRHYYYVDDGSCQRCQIGMVGPDTGLDWSYTISDESRSVVRGGKWGRTKVDIKAKGGYIIAAGSVHSKTGQPYIGSAAVTPELLASLPLFDSEAFAASKAEHEVRRAAHKRDQELDLERRYPRPAKVSATRHACRQRAQKLANLPVTPGEQVPENLAVLAQCPLVAWVRAHPEGLNYQIRQVLASNIAHLAGDGGNAFYTDLLSAHPEFDSGEAKRIWNKAIEFKDKAPLTYRYAMEEGNWPGPAPVDVSAPARLVYQVIRVPPALLAAALALEERYAYVLSADAVFDRKLFSNYGVKPFGRMGAEYRFWMTPAFDALRPMFKTITFRTDGVDDAEVLNMFDRDRMPRPSGPCAACPPDLWALALNLTNGNEHEANYILDWLAFRLRHPHLPQAALTLAGDPGTGKGSFCAIAQAVCGPYQSTASQSALESDWNDHIPNSILVVANEISANLMRDKRRVANALKDQVLAGERVTINPKCGKKYTIVNSTGWIICTNHDLAITLENRDRRYSIIRGDGVLLATPEGAALVDRVHAGVKDTAWVATVVDHLYSRPLDGFNARLPLENEARAKAKEQSRTPVEAYFAQLMSPEGNLTSGNRTTTEIWNDYKAWCARTGEACLSETAFSRMVPTALTPVRWDLPREPIFGGATTSPRRPQARGYTLPDYGQDAFLPRQYSFAAPPNTGASQPAQRPRRAV